jgi:hypothetical protein
MSPATIIDTCRDSDHGRAFIAAIESGCNGLSFVSTGICPGCETCRDEYAPDVPLAEFHDLWANGEVIAEPSFSHCGCEICGSRLGGSFEPWHGIAADGEIFHGDHACGDCVLRLGNGDPPEKWEG